MKNDINLARVDLAFIEKFMKKARIYKISKVLVLTLNKSGTVYIQEKNKEFKTFENVEV